MTEPIQQRKFITIVKGLTDGITIMFLITEALMHQQIMVQMFLILIIFMGDLRELIHPIRMFTSLKEI